MVGKQSLKIDATQFLQGLCTSDYTGDGGIGASSSNLTLLSGIGTVRATPITALTTSAPSNPFIASCESADGNYGEGQRFYITDQGEFYSSTINDAGTSTFTNLKNATTTTSYVANTTDLLPFAGKFYVTKTAEIVRFTPGSPYTVDETWFTVTATGTHSFNSGGPHPLLVYNDLLFVGDGSRLLSITSAGVSSVAISLNSSEQILSLGIDPGTGMMMIGATTAIYFNAKDSYRSFVYLYDGASSYPIRKVPVDGQPVSFRSVGGQVFVGIDNTIQVWNGAGTTFLRRLTTALEQYASWPFKMRTTSFNNTFCVVDGTQILAYGDVLNGKKIWYPIGKNNASTNEISLLTFAGYVSQSVTHTNARPVLLYNTVVSSVQKFYYLSPLDSTVAGTGIFYTNNIIFPRPVNIHRVRVITTGITTTAGLGGVAIIDETQTATSPTVSTFMVASGTQYTFDFDYGSKKVQILQPKITLDTQAFGIVALIIYYDVAE